MGELNHTAGKNQNLRPRFYADDQALMARSAVRNGELVMDRNRVLLIGGALVLVLFLAYLFAPGSILPR